ncbi:hypothetical protein, partial [Neisseria sicca]|uniref:hypothetical protein n=1 Tax=Neisseria sicca TaxID=490 RepID=UPI003C782D03
GDGLGRKKQHDGDCQCADMGRRQKHDKPLFKKKRTEAQIIRRENSRYFITSACLCRFVSFKQP